MPLISDSIRQVRPLNSPLLTGSSAPSQPPRFSFDAIPRSQENSLLWTKIVVLAALAVGCGGGVTESNQEARGDSPGGASTVAGLAALNEQETSEEAPPAAATPSPVELPSIEQLEAELLLPPPELAMVSDPTLSMEGDPEDYPCPKSVGGVPVEIIRERHPSTGVLMRIKSVIAGSADAESGAVLHGPEWAYFDTAALASIRWWNGNVAHGPAQHWWRVGARKSEGRFKDGERDGLRREYAKNGQLRSQGAYQGGVPVGLHEEWFPSGQRMRSESYLNGTFHGLRQLWDRDGLLVLRENYDHGVRHGKWSDFHPGDGDLREWGQFSRGARTGTWQRGSEDGVILESVAFENDRRHGVAKIWSRAGNLIEEVRYVHGMKTGPRRTWYDGGVLQSTGELEDGLRTGYWIYYKADGTPNELWSGEYAEDQRIGPGTPPTNDTNDTVDAGEAADIDNAAGR